MVDLWLGLFVIILYVLMGIMFVLMGATFLVVRPFIGSGGLEIAAGIIFIICGAFFCSIILVFSVAYFLIAPATIIGGIALLKAQLPVLVLQPEH